MDTARVVVWCQWQARKADDDDWARLAARTMKRLGEVVPYLSQWYAHPDSVEEPLSHPVPADIEGHVRLLRSYSAPDLREVIGHYWNGEAEESDRSSTFLFFASPETKYADMAFLDMRFSTAELNGAALSSVSTELFKILVEEWRADRGWCRLCSTVGVPVDRDESENEFGWLSFMEYPELVQCLDELDFVSAEPFLDGLIVRAGEGLADFTDDTLWQMQKATVDPVCIPFPDRPANRLDPSVNRHKNRAADWAIVSSKPYDAYLSVLQGYHLNSDGKVINTDVLNTWYRLADDACEYLDKLGIPNFITSDGVGCKSGIGVHFVVHHYRPFGVQFQWDAKFLQDERYLAEAVAQEAGPLGDLARRVDDMVSRAVLDLLADAGYRVEAAAREQCAEDSPQLRDNEKYVRPVSYKLFDYSATRMV